MPAKMLGELRPIVHRFTLGGFEATTILDGAQIRDSLSPPFAVGQPPEALAEHARKNLLPAGKFENTFTPTLVNTGRELVLFDTGNGSLRRDSGAGFLTARLAAAGYRPEDVDVVAFTHVHPDHIGGVMEGDGPAFPNARYVIGRVEFDEWSSGARIPEARKDNRDLFLKVIPPLAEKMTFLEPGQDVVGGIRAVEAYGHSLGHMAYAIESEGQALLVWGDVTNHYAFSLQNPDWRVGFDDDKDLAIATRKRILGMVAAERMLVVGHHMPFPAVGYVAADGSGYRWMPASYQIRTGL